MNNTTAGLPELLGPSKFSAAGFLGSDTRIPEEIIKEDRQTLENLHLNEKKVSLFLRNACSAAERAFGNPVDISEGVVAVYHEARGCIPSPFPEDGTFPKGETVITEKATGTSFTATPLSLHLIEKYGFFQGRGSPYRIDPDIACRILNIN